MQVLYVIGKLASILHPNWEQAQLTYMQAQLGWQSWQTQDENDHLQDIWHPKQHYYNTSSRSNWVLNILGLLFAQTIKMNSRKRIEANVKTIQRFKAVKLCFKFALQMNKLIVETSDKGRHS